MFVVDDPMLALIVRFVGSDREVAASDGEFLQQQIRVVSDYVGRFPEREREARALEWIEANAERYRRQWQRDLVAEHLADSRCPDCPLVRADDSTHCEIHERWLETLNSYVNDEISSARYVEDTLVLLAAHKSRLKVAGFSGKPG